jgi:ribA/ribD-fused uncharacterized protein
MKVTKKHVLFWGEWPSNWYPAEFDVEVMLEGKREIKHFFNSEQYFMFIKAVVFGDIETAKKILATKDPKKAKALGREVKCYDDKVWNSMRYKVMVDANKAKYSQNKDLKELILNPEIADKGFVESSPLDLCWGTGFAETHPDADDETKWKGQNLLGKALDEVRNWLSEK